MRQASLATVVAGLVGLLLVAGCAAPIRAIRVDPNGRIA